MSESRPQVEPDWSIETKQYHSWDPGRDLIACIRDYQRVEHRGGPIAWLRRKSAVIRHRFWSAVSGAEIPISTKIGGGLLIPHPNGIVIHPDVTIGPNCLIFQQVTLGSNYRGTPRVGARVDIGAGAKILGPIQIGDYAVIGANAVVLEDVPAGATVAGIPARVIRAPPDQGPSVT